jgi:hypothetical protein
MAAQQEPNYRQRLMIRDGRWTCGYCGAGIENEEMVHETGCRAVRPVFFGVPDVAIGVDYEMTLTLDLHDLGLQHGRGAGCQCRGLAHRVTIFIDPAQHDLHRDDDCPADTPLAAELLQALHEQAHPEGTVFAENCRERGCIDVGA